MALNFSRAAISSSRKANCTRRSSGTAPAAAAGRWQAPPWQRGEPLPVQPFLDAGDALVVDIDVAHHVRNHRAVRIDALVLGEEADAGNSQPVNLLLLLRRDFALEPDEAALGRQPVAQFAGVKIGQHGGEQLFRLSTSISLRGSLERGRLHVGGEDHAVAVEDVGPGGRQRVLTDAAARAVAVADRGEHDEAQRDHSVDAGEGEDGEAEAGLGLDLAVDVAAIERRAQEALPFRVVRQRRRLAAWPSPHRRRCRQAAGQLGRGGRGRRQHGADRIGRGLRRQVRRPRRQLVETVELARQIGCSGDGGRPGPGCGRGIELGPFGAQRGDGVALATQFAAQSWRPVRPARWNRT